MVKMRTEDSADERPIQVLGVRHSTRKTTMDPTCPDTEDFLIDPVVIDPMVMDPVVIGPSSQPATPLVPHQPFPSLGSQPLVPPTESSEHLPTQPSAPLVPRQPSPSLVSQPLVPPSPVSSEPSLALASQQVVTSTPTLSLPDPKWPEWFMRSYELLSAQDLGPTFTKTIKQYVELEAHSSFDMGGIHMGFKKTSRPSQVDWWVGRGHSKAPLIKDVTSFKRSWWTWWKVLQPSWRNAGGVDSRLGSSHCTVLAGDEGWSVMDKHGQNTFLTMLVTLVWWNFSLLDKGEEGVNDPGWTAAVEDVQWVMSQVLGWK